MGVPQQVWVEKSVHGVEIHQLSCKEKVPRAPFSKEGHADVFWDMGGPITIDSFEKGTIINGAFYCQLLRINSPYLLNGSCSKENS